MPWITRISLIFGVVFCALVGSSRAAQNPQSKASSTNPADALPNAPKNPLGDALALFRKGEFDAAIYKYQQIIAQNPKSPDAHAGLARVYLKENDVDQAYATIEKALQVADSAPVRVALGEVYFRQGRIPEAEREWVAVIDSGYGYRNPRAYLGLARVRWALSMNKSAWAMIEKAHQLDPNDPEIRQRWALRLSRAERIKYLEEYLKSQNNEDPETRASLRQYLEYLKARAGDSRTCHLLTRVDSIESQLVYLLAGPTSLRAFGLSGYINGEKSKLLLDTGISGITINRELAERAGIKELSETKVSGLGDRGDRRGYYGIAGSIKVGGLEFKDCPVRVVDARSLLGEEGFVGADIFSDFLVDLDFAHGKLRLAPLPQRPPEGGAGDHPVPLWTDEEVDNSVTGNTQDRYIAPEMNSYTQAYRFGQDLLVPTLIGEPPTPAKLFLIASAAFSSYITPAAAREVTKVHRGNFTVKGMSGTVNKVYSADKVVLQFGRLRQENQNLDAIDLTKISDAMGTEASGSLGFTVLRPLDIKIDYRDGLVDFMLPTAKH